MERPFMQINKLTTRLFLGLAALAVTTLATPAQASTVTFSFTGANSTGTYTATVGGVTITASAWAINSNGVSTNTFAAGTLGQYSGYGLGVCDASENGGESGCSSSEKPVDNIGGYDDYVLFYFGGTSVNFSSIVLKSDSTGEEDEHASSDRDASYLVGSLGSISGKKYSDFGTFTNLNCSSCANPVTFGLTGSGTYLLFGAAKGTTDLNDSFKISSLTITTNSVTGQDISAVPEPGSMVLLGTGILGLASRLRRRKQ
jgi:hypothetical protein